MSAPSVPVAAPSTVAHDSAAVERLLATACELFYREGIHAVGIQRVIAEAGVAKATLYAHFASKDDLVAACLARRSAALQTRLVEALSTHDDPQARLLCLFDLYVEWLASTDFRGCPFQNAESELACATHPAKAVLRAHRHWVHELIVGLVREAGVDDPAPLTGALLVLMEGAAARALGEHGPQAGRDARWAAARLLAAATARPAARPRRSRPARERGR